MKFKFATFFLFLFFPYLTLSIYAANEINIKKVGILLYTKNSLPNFEGLKAGLQERNYVEGKNIHYLFNGTIDSIDELDSAVEKLLAQKPDLIYSAPTPPLLALQKATIKNKIPILFGPVNDPVGAGLITNQKHPGGNISGVMLTESEGKRLQLILDFSPKNKNVLLPYNPDDKSATISLKNTKAAAKILGIEIKEQAVRNVEEINKMLSNLPGDISAIYLPRDGMIMAQIDDFVTAAIKHKLILSSTRTDLVIRGALYSYGFDGFEVGKQVARLVDLVLKGRNIGDIPVETAEDYMAINLKTANAIGITIPSHILRRADKVIR
ncbi:MAG: hypothetical protein A2504_01360 [Bdellovibrionales bacterium RIFOXYD12_FULL_39_22]|nr:MAG: hypothetical protein A2385_02250 [Bdellovibrionales bacterium RIFOXYB1_FULL_39_21]OFZ42754.1 MAG: hypothetical protein A2485_10435 [Bdellovibrionales bacterium RIFOXYC12_FULL_39_17]OFZ47313.1 MAG: hypothetical protein A2404_15040 [Bdellovibrionales bacterium RIFOXYC1_FULL_39_130]OFZ72260.1 MAG: hypothetical protein A2451_04930 [Bdellovibrionales bacterium RIFOXYC2_FULL_39_8]OFZ75479.1 MAG: hypothetical protein A2560_04310 [Bdellovibrionales bacterium RIFOXYD1_FULL_39_84]OFZ93433.1 MAG: